MLLLSRIVVLGSCLIIIISSIMFLDNGIASLKKSLKNVEKGMNQVEDVAEDGINIIDSFVTDLEGAQSYVEDFLAGDIISCVEKIVSKTCNVTDNDKLSMFEMENFTAECDVSDVLESVENIRNRYLTLNQGISEEVVNTRSDLVEIVEITHNLEKTVHSFNWAFYVAAALSILLDLVVSLLAYGIVQAWRGQIRSLYNCCRGGFLLPFFILNVLLMWISASVFLVGAVVTSDFCYTSPDPMVEIVLDNNADRFTSLTYQFSRYVLKGCSDTTNPITIGLDDLAKKFFSISSILRSIHYLINWIISEDTEQLEALCGQEISPMISFLEFLDLEFHSLLNTAEAVRELFFCENWHPIYTYIVHDALCYDGVKGMTWVYCTLSTIGFFGMVVLTLRFTMFLEEDGKESSTDAAEIVEDDASTQ